MRDQATEAATALLREDCGKGAKGDGVRLSHALAEYLVQVQGVTDFAERRVGQDWSTVFVEKHCHSLSV